MNVRILVIGLFFLALPVIAAEKPNSPGNLEGVVVNDLTSQSTFTLNEGTWRDCTADDSLYIVRCDVDNGSISITDSNGRNSVIPINHARYFNSTSYGKNLHQFLYFGTWTREINGLRLSYPFKMSVYYYDEMNPSKLEGYINVEDIGVSQRLIGRTVN